MIVYQYIYDKLKTYTGDKYLIEELAQDVRIKLYKSRKTSKDFKDVNQHKKYINLIIRSCFIDHKRKIETSLHYEVEQDGIVPDKIVENENLHKLIQSLPERQSEVIYLRYYFGLSFQQIARLFKCSKNTALSYFHYAKIKLKKLKNLKKLYYEI